MWHYRYNVFVHFLKEESNIIFYVPWKTISCTYQEYIYNFLVFILKKWHCTYDLIQKHWISDSMLHFFLIYNILLDETHSNKWGESLWFHIHSSNPNIIDHTLTQKEIDNIYKEYLDSYKNSITSGYQRIWNEQTLSLKQYTLWSTRQKNNHIKKIDRTYLLSCLSTINRRHNNHKLYWSAWWFYAVNQLVITKRWECFFVCWYDGHIYSKHISAPFDSFSSWIFDDEDYNLSWYTCIVFLVANTEYVFAKYGNRWYRFIMIESGSIWCMFRNFYSEKWYLELGWYHDKVCLSAISDLWLFTVTPHTIVSHTILLCL
jgi:hypothetical protein